MIKVKFVNVGGKKRKVILKQTVPASELPETFAIKSTVEVKGKNYVIQSATPALLSEAEKKGTLTIEVCEYVEPKTGGIGPDIWHIIPTLENALPAGSDMPVDGSEWCMNDDDWRQVEFVADQHLPVVEAVFEQIRALKLATENKEQPGLYKHVFVRKEITAPLDGLRLTLEELVQAMPNTKADSVKALAFEGSSTRVLGGFAIEEADDCWVYGCAPHGTIEALAIAGACRRGAPLVEGLTLVDWCQCRFITSSKTTP